MRPDRTMRSFRTRIIFVGVPFDFLHFYPALPGANSRFRPGISPVRSPSSLEGSEALTERRTVCGRKLNWRAKGGC